MLKDLLYKVKLKAVLGSTDVEIKSLHIDSRAVTKGGCFIAVKGATTDGHNFIDTAIKNGAVAIVAQQLPINNLACITYIEVADSASAAGFMAHNFYGEPSVELKIIGVTGTNGKTTVVTILYNLNLVSVVGLSAQ